MFQPLSPSVSPHPYQVLPVEWTAAQRCHTIISVLLFQAGWIHSYSATGRKQAHDPPGSLHTIVSSVEWSSLKGRGPRWFTVRKTICFTRTSHTCLCHRLWRGQFTEIIQTVSSFFRKDLRPVKTTCYDRKRVNKPNIPQGFPIVLFCQLTDFL